MVQIYTLKEREVCNMNTKKETRGFPLLLKMKKLLTYIRSCSCGTRGEVGTVQGIQATPQDHVTDVWLFVATFAKHPARNVID